MGGTSRVYPDTSFLLVPALLMGDVEVVRQTFYRMKGGAFRVIIPQLVLGEAFAVIMRKVPGWDERAECLRRLQDVLRDYGVDVGGCLPNASSEACRIMLELEEVDSSLTENDRMMLAVVLADPHSKFLLTNDTMLLRNRAVEEYELRLRREGRRVEKLKIADSI